MEHADHFKQTSFYCESDFCDRLKTHNCIDHDQALCYKCLVDFHLKCQCNQIPNKNDILAGLNLTKEMLSLIQSEPEYKEIKSLSARNFNKESTSLNEMHANFDEKYSNITENISLYEFHSIIQEFNQ